MSETKIKNYSGCREIDEILNEKNDEIKLELLKAYSLLGQKKYEEAFSLYKKLADKNICEAIYYLGTCYEEGRGTEKDYKKAFLCYKEAADLDYEDAIMSLAICYFFGKGINEDIEKAYEYFEKAAKLGNEDAIAIINKFNK